jgi:hypothetical protein
MLTTTCCPVVSHHANQDKQLTDEDLIQLASEMRANPNQIKKVEALWLSGMMRPNSCEASQRTLTMMIDRQGIECVQCRQQDYGYWDTASCIGDSANQ